MTLPVRDPEKEIGQEAMGILTTLFSRVENVSERGRDLETLGRFLSDEIVFLDLAKEHRLPGAMLIGLAKGFAVFHERILEALRVRERELTPEGRAETEPERLRVEDVVDTLGEYPSQPRGPEPWSILTDIFRGIEWYSDAGHFPENLAALVADDMNFLGIARDHEIPLSVITGIAREAAAMHARVLERLRDR